MKLPFHRTRSGHRTVLADGPLPAAPPAPVRSLRVARMLAVAHRLEALIATGELRNRGALARAIGVTQGRVSQLMDLLLLAPDIQEELLFMEVPPGADPVPERALRFVVGARAWGEQRRRWAALRMHGGRGSRARPWAGEKHPARGARSRAGVLPTAAREPG